jgi:hypothetical protein
MAGLIQPGEDVKYVLSGDITDFSPYNRACIYTENEGEVTLAGDDDVKFAGILMAVQISSSVQQGYNMEAYDGDNVTLKKKGIVPAIGAGVIRPGMPVGLAEDGKLKELDEFYTTPTVDQVVQQVGVAETRCGADGETFQVRLLMK